MPFADPHRISRQFRSYSRSLGWVLRDALARVWTHALWITALNIAGVASGAASLGGIVLLARHAGSDQPIRIGQFTFELSTSAASVISFAIALALLGIISGFCLYAAERLIMRVTATCEKFNADRLATYVGDPRYRGWTDAIDRPLKTHLNRLLTSGTRYTAYVIRDSLRLILPVLTFLFAVSVLFWIDWLVTALLAPVVMAYLIPLYVINFNVSKLQSEFRKAAPLARRTAMRQLRQAFQHGGEIAASESDEGCDSKVDHVRQLHYTRMLTPKRVQLLNTVFAMICLLALLVYFTIDNRVHGRPWADLLAYVVALRFTVTSLRQVSILLAKFSRYLPEYRVFARVVERAERIARYRAKLAARSTHWPDSFTVKIGRHGLWNSHRRLTFAPGTPLWVVVPDSGGMSGAELGAVTARLERRLSQPVDFAGRTLVIGSLNGHVSSACSDEVPRPIVIHGSLLQIEAREATASLMHANASSPIVLVDDDPAMPLQTPIATAGVVVMNHRKIIGGGDMNWLRDHLDEITQAMKGYAVPAEMRDSIDDDDDDDLDE